MQPANRSAELNQAAFYRRELNLFTNTLETTNSMFCI
jgi:hypothetical protein